ncbi:MAG: hypothetical protein FJ147_13635 [Deltaproteobacteria bacterium]|nr:hypothetical protein [Deltaproteobacteria bacterium]
MDWGALISSTLQMYRQAATETWQKITRNWWVAFLPLLYGVILLITGSFVFRLGMLGGLIFGFTSAMCTSSYLFFLAGVVNGQRMVLSELTESWRPYLSPVITVLFFLFLVRLTLSYALPPVEASQDITFIVTVILLIILNPIPEVIYLGRSDGFGLLQESVDFLRENWIEWFLPLVLLTILSLGFPSAFVSPLQVGQLGFPFMSVMGLLGGSLDNLFWNVLGMLLLFALMVFRGLLFRSLFGSSRRQRIFRSRLS